MLGQTSPEALQVWGSLFPGQLTNSPAVPDALEEPELRIGDALANLVALGFTDTDQSSVLHVPELELVVSGDVAYNGVHMWMAGSTPETRANWLRALNIVESLGAKTLIAGHRSPDAADDDARRQLDFSREYLTGYEQALAESATPAELIAQMEAHDPELGNPYTLWVGAHDLLSS